MQVQMQLSRIIISEINQHQLIYLREVDGTRQFPIVIGLFEATSIDRRVKHYDVPRPQTHDLLVSTVEMLGAELDSISITDLRDQTYYANLRIRKDGEIIEVDARPSDAIAVAVRCEPSAAHFRRGRGHRGSHQRGRLDLAGGAPLHRTPPPLPAGQQFQWDSWDSRLGNR